MTRTHPVTARRNGGCTPINELGVGYMASWQVKLALVAQKNRREVYAGAADHHASPDRGAGRYEHVDLGQRNRQVQVSVDTAKPHGKSITLDQVVKTTGGGGLVVAAVNTSQ